MTTRVGRVRYRSGWGWICEQAGTRWALDTGESEAPYLFNTDGGWWLITKDGAEQYMAAGLRDAMDNAALAFHEGVRPL